MAKTIDMIKEYESDVVAAYRSWLREAKKELNYCLSYQWKAEDKKTLDAQGRPALTFNEIQPIIRTVSGYERQNKKDIKVIGVEGGDDFIAHIMNLLIKNIMIGGYGEYKMSQMFLDGIRSSKGWIEPDVVFNDDPVNGTIKLRNGLYYQYFPDPDYVEYDMGDAEFLIKRLKLTETGIRNYFPDKERVIKKLKPAESPIDEAGQLEDDDDTGYEQPAHGSTEDENVPYTRSNRRKLYDLTYCWYKKYEKKLYIVDLLEGEVKDVTEERLTVRDQRGMLEAVNKNGKENIAFIHQRVGVPWIAAKSGNELLEDNISPYWPHVKVFPVVPYVASFSPAARRPEKKFQSLVKPLIDPQNEQNKRISQRLHIINSTANSMIIADKDAMTPDEWADFEQNGSMPGYIAKIKNGAQFKRDHPIAAGQMHTMLSAESSEKLKSISGVNADLLGQGDKNASGRALMIRQAQGIMVIQDTFDNHKYSRDVLGRILIGMILNSYSPEKIVRIVGEKRMVPDPETGEVVDEIGEITFNEAREVLEEFDILKYDVAIDETQMSPVMRMAVSEELISLAEKGIIPPGIADDLIIDGLSIPNKEEIKARVKQQMDQAQQVAQGELQQ